MATSPRRLPKLDLTPASSPTRLKRRALSKSPTKRPRNSPGGGNGGGGAPGSASATGRPRRRRPRSTRSGREERDREERDTPPSPTDDAAAAAWSSSSAESDSDEDGGSRDNPFRLGSTGYTPRPEESVQYALQGKMRDFVLPTGGGFASVDLRRIKSGPALVPEGIVTVGKRKHVIQRGPPKAIARILHRLNRKRTLVMRYFADQTVNRWKQSLQYVIFKAWAGVTKSRPKSVASMLKFISRARGRGVRFWFNRWLDTHCARKLENLRIKEMKMEAEHRLRMLEIETKSLEAEQVNGLVAKDLREVKETSVRQAASLSKLDKKNTWLEEKVEALSDELRQLHALLENPDLYLGSEVGAMSGEWSRVIGTNGEAKDESVGDGTWAGESLLEEADRILSGLGKRPWQDGAMASRLDQEVAADKARAEEQE